MSRDCDDALANLYNYLDAELDDTSAARIKAHLEECSGCDRPYDFEIRLRQVIKERLNEDVPEVFMVRLRTLLVSETWTE